MKRIGLAVPLVVFIWSGLAYGQAAPAGPAGGGSAGGAAAGGGAPNIVVVPQAPANPTPAYTGPIGGGNATGASSRPITGPNDRDGFDLLPKSSGGGTARGSEGSPIFSGGSRMSASSNASSHTVRRGDTLWEICDFYFQNPYQWPRIWSYNPQIQNPHWIYPGDNVRLKAGTGGAEAKSPAQGGSLIDRRRQVSAMTVFLRGEGYIEDGSDQVWGEITGAREDKMFLTIFDEVYLRIAEGKNVQVGQELTIFRPVREVDQGKIVEFQGAVRIDQWNPKERIARARITEANDTVERGARIGPLQRSFEVVPPARNEQEVKSTVIASLSPHNLYGQHQVVFVAAGSKAGLRAGNRMFVTHKGDGWHDTLPARGAAMRIATESNSPAATEAIPRPRSNAELPEEVTAELRVISVREGTAMCIVLDARREIEPGDPVIARKGY